MGVSVRLSNEICQKRNEMLNEKGIKAEICCTDDLTVSNVELIGYYPNCASDCFPLGKNVIEYLMPASLK